MNTIYINNLIILMVFTFLCTEKYGKTLHLCKHHNVFCSGVVIQVNDLKPGQSPGMQRMNGLQSLRCCWFCCHPLVIVIYDVTLTSL